MRHALLRRLFGEGVPLNMAVATEGEGIVSREYVPSLSALLRDSETEDTARWQGTVHNVIGPILCGALLPQKQGPSPVDILVPGG